MIKPSCTVERSSKDPGESNSMNTLCQIACVYCGENHYVHKCQMFSSQSTEDKSKFILDNKLCFSCLRRGHRLTRDCRNRAICARCKKCHPTSLHEDRSATADTPSQVRQSNENMSSLSCCVDRSDGGSTSMIIPVWLSATTSPETETLVYTGYTK